MCECQTFQVQVKMFCVFKQWATFEIARGLPYYLLCLTAQNYKLPAIEPCHTDMGVEYSNGNPFGLYRENSLQTTLCHRKK